jgi:hypothetical protein
MSRYSMHLTTFALIGLVMICRINGQRPFSDRFPEDDRDFRPSQHDSNRPRPPLRPIDERIPSPQRKPERWNEIIEDERQLNHYDLDERRPTNYDLDERRPANNHLEDRREHNYHMYPLPRNNEFPVRSGFPLIDKIPLKVSRLANALNPFSPTNQNQIK